MTGYGKSEVRKDGIFVSVEIKSVNSRFLDISLRLPKILQSKEFEIRELIRQKISRGKVTASVELEIDSSIQPPIKVNFDIANALVKELKQLKKKTKVKGKIKLEHLLGIPQIFEAERDDVSEEGWELVKMAIDEAIGKLIESRRKEGIELAKDISKRIELISEKVDKILSLSNKSLSERQSKLREKVEKVFKDIEFDKNRLEAELVILADKLDVTEECIRLKSHIKFFLETLNSDDVAVGRRLNFLLQEMLREATTIGAKVEDAQITYLVVSIKEEIEKVREQLQNVE
jgi:uncharacterized protein (TIGR00255 family)